MKEALKSRREKNRQRLLELQHEVGIQSSELIFQVTTHTQHQRQTKGRERQRRGSLLCNQAERLVSFGGDRA
jgi:predicted translin family RNA/ssDNA-binding protein